jgi:hypothetical protein
MKLCKNYKYSLPVSYYQSLRERVFPLLPYTSFFEQVAAIDEQHIE